MEKKWLPGGEGGGRRLRAQRRHLLADVLHDLGPVHPHGPAAPAVRDLVRRGGPTAAGLGAVSQTG